MPFADDAAVLIHDRFPASEPPTLPLRGHSGAPIKKEIIRAMSRQLQAEKACFATLDELNGHLQAILRKRQRQCSG